MMHLFLFKDSPDDLPGAYLRVWRSCLPKDVNKLAQALVGRKTMPFQLHHHPVFKKRHYFLTCFSHCVERGLIFAKSSERPNARLRNHLLNYAVADSLKIENVGLSNA